MIFSQSHKAIWPFRILSEQNFLEWVAFIQLVHLFVHSFSSIVCFQFYTHSNKMAP